MADTLQKPTNQRIIRDRLAAWESKTNSKASLSDNQKDSIIELTSKASERPIPIDLPEDETQFAMSKHQDILQSPSYHETISKFFQTTEEDSLSKIENAQQFLSWFAEIENDIEKEDEDTYRTYIAELHHYESQCDNILQEVSGALDFLNGLQHQYISVSTKTNALHEACEDLLAEQTRLINTAENISNKLSYFNEYDRITTKLGLPSLAVTNESFVPMLSRLDECILYLNNNPLYRESPVFLTRFRQCLSKALNLIKSHVVQILQHATQQVQPTKESPSIGDNAFTLFYGKFRANSTRVKALMEQLEFRIDKSPEYQQILSDCHQCYFNQRELLLGPSISTTIADLASKHFRDHCTLMRSGCAFMVHVSEDEYQLYFNFFSKPTPMLDNMLERLCSHLYDTFRPLIIHINHLETLSELCSILKIEMLEEHVLNNPLELKAFEAICRQMLMDIQERLVYRTYIYIKSDILSYSPAQGDLAYPEKLEMMESIAESLKKDSIKGHTRSGSNASSTTGHSRTGSTVSNTSQEVADINKNDTIELSLKEIDISSESGRVTPFGTTMPMSPADLHGMWYPTVRRTLVTLSKLYRCIDKTTFQGLSQEALQSCIQSLKTAKDGITKRKTKVDGQLFLVKHLLILREQIAPFHADFSIRETALDFTKFKDAAYGLIHSKSKLFQFNSNNAVLQFILEGTPQVTEYFVDSKRDVDQELKGTCEEFIHHVTELFVLPLQMLISRANVVISMKKEESIKSVSLSSQPFATAEKVHDVVSETYKLIKSHLVGVHRSMSLYLANRDTEVILFKPIKVNVQNCFHELYKILDEHYSEEDQQIVAAPSIEQTIKRKEHLVFLSPPTHAGRKRDQEGHITACLILTSALTGSYGQSSSVILSVRQCSSFVQSKVSIGEVTIDVKNAQNPEIVPVKFFDNDSPQSILQHLQWIMQKDVLGQDVFLIGPPGPLRRQIAMMYLELTNRESEYISLSRDTTESDIKQRREIHSGNAFYIDQCAVRAATHGRILVLEGIEKAERNVLPILNNLLENREMQLDDGRFLVAADRYDKLLKEHTQEELDDLKLVRVSEQFRVIALGHPVPRYKGNPLDPPLRSRFQARDIHSPTFKEMHKMLNDKLSNVPTQQLAQIMSFGTAVLTKESNTLGLPDFPIMNVDAIAQILNVLPNANRYNLVKTLYPYDIMLGKEGQIAVKELLSKFELSEGNCTNKQIQEISPAECCDGYAKVVFSDLSSIKVKIGTKGIKRSVKESFVSTTYLENLLAEIIQSHMVQDICIIGPKGCGKSAIVDHFAELFGYHVEQIMLYQDMTSRDLLQQRHTLPNGDTTWKLAPLITAALEGRLAILDGLHRMNQGSFGVLHRLIHDRELQLFDGTRLLRTDRFKEILEKTGKTPTELKAKGIHQIHPSFRIIALAEPPVSGSGTQQWLTPEMLTMFLFHNQRRLSKTEEMHVINSKIKGCPDLDKLYEFVHELRSSTDPAMTSLAASLSTRQLLRIGQRVSAFPSKDFYNIIHKACLARFLPRLPRLSLDQALDAADIKNVKVTNSITDLDKNITCEIKDGTLRIGQTAITLFKPENKTKVPDILFYENSQHLNIMEDMMKDFLLGEHLLLVGNQGVGKNKIVDRFLQLLNRPREYIQLHRDTTVHTLTLQPTVKDGIIKFEDSPLVRAVKEGHVLVVDEADKAPTHVTCILKSLVESGEMHLGDGRRIVSYKSGIKASPQFIVSNPNFRMIVLANRPGFPFLGNDFFGALGDTFSCHAIDNPDMASEMEMLKQYGPNVPEGTLRKLVQAFGELREIADQGLIAYPYSTREVVNMVKHLQKYPNDGLTTIVRNVFDFDSYSSELKETIVNTMQKHGIPFGTKEAVVNLAKLISLPIFNIQGTLHLTSQRYEKQTTIPVEINDVYIKGPIETTIQKFRIEREESRASIFSEQDAYWTLPMIDTNVVCDIAVTKGENRSQGKGTTDMIHIATVNPIGLYTLNTSTSEVGYISMYDLFPGTSGSFRPRVKLAPLATPLDDSLLLHEEVTNVLLSVNYENGEIRRLVCKSLPETQPEKRRFPSNAFQNTNIFKMLPSSMPNSKGTILIYKKKGGEIIAFSGNYTYTLSLPCNIEHIFQVGDNQWIITSPDNKKYIVRINDNNEFTFYSVEEKDVLLTLLASAMLPLSDTQLSKSLEKPVSGPNRIVVTPDSYATILYGFPDVEDSEIYSIMRTPLPEDKSSRDKSDSFIRVLNKGPTLATSNPDSSVIYLPNSGQVIRSLPSWKLPEDAYEKENKPRDVSGFLEVTDVVNRTLRYIAVPGASRTSPYTSWLLNISETPLLMASTGNDGLVTVDVGGCVRTWETSLTNLERSLEEWRRMIGFSGNKPLQVTYDRKSGRTADGPKHGKIDPTGAAHHGGNTWAGGTGGSNTAGLGGFGGPYRLDGGHSKVYQVPQSEKDQVPDEVKRAAHEMAQKAFKERLKEINMSAYDADTYEKFSRSVRTQVQSLRVILDGLQAKGKERQWLKNQAYGDFDDSKLIEGLTGEKSIYKRRGEKEPELGTPQEKPKRVRLLVDVSGSMYRFNGYDGRLEREMEATLMMMEALQGYDEKFKYDIIGHSGEDYKVELCKTEKVPSNNKERLVILKTMHAHSQFCLSGDNTLSATKHAIDSIAEEEADEHFVIILSDANFDRYGIPPRRFGQLLRSNEKVNAYAIFIGSLEDQAEQLIKELPMGHAFACMDTKNLPQILQQIFTSTMLSFG